MKQLSPRDRDDICTILALGGTRVVAARYVGCPVSTIDELEASDPEFARRMRAAIAQIEALQLKNVGDVARARQDWRASAWVLEHRFPQRYTRKPPTAAALRRFGRALDSIVDMMLAEVHDAPARERILAHLKELVRQLEPQSRPRRDQ